MERKIVSGTMLTLLLIGMLTLAFKIQTVETEPTTIIVPDNYPTVQEAVNAANPRDIIFIRSGTYEESSYTLTIYSSPLGVTFTVDGVSRTTPWSGIYTEGTSVSVVMPETHMGYIVPYDLYVWSHWLEDGDTNRTKTFALTTNTTWTGVSRFIADINGNGVVDIFDVVIAALAFGSKPEDPNWNPLLDLNQDRIIDIFDFVVIAVNFGKTW